MDRSGTSGGYTEIVDAAQPAAVGLAVGTGTARDRYHISAEPLDPVAIAALVSGPSTGGLATFTGLVRDHNAGRRVLWIDYEAHEALARTVFARIGVEAQARWPGATVAIHHRIGTVAIGQASVVIAAASAHRAEAFSACRFAIERVKQIAPVWKHEHFEGGDVWIEGATADPEDEAALKTAVERACS
jgi:molybdopterin synthase catalytic subunit